MENVSNTVDQAIGNLIGSTNVAAKAELLKHESLEMETVDNSGMKDSISSNDEISKAKESLENAVEEVQSEVKDTVSEIKEEVPEVISDVKEETIAAVDSAPIVEDKIEASVASVADEVAPAAESVERVSEVISTAESENAENTEKVAESESSVNSEIEGTTAESSIELAAEASTETIPEIAKEIDSPAIPEGAEPIAESISVVPSEIAEPIANSIVEPVAETVEAATESAPITDEADLKTGVIAAEGAVKVSEEKTAKTEEEVQEELKPWLDWDLDSFDDSRVIAECADVQDGGSPEKLKFVIQNLFPKYESALKERVSIAEAAYYESGGEEGTFAFPYSTEDKQFESEKKRIKGIRHTRIQSQTAERNKNLAEKEAILNELRTLVDAKDSNHNIKVLQAIQEQWRTIGQVPSANAKGLWANYNALVDRYYDQRRIYLELRDIDRRKNLQLKEGIVSKTIDLLQHSDVLESVKILNTYHQEYKKIGPVPHNVQEALWQRFKAASDEIYSKRNAVMDKVKADWDVNKEVKTKIIEDLSEYLTFDSDRINDWNSKTQSILAIQKKWDASGPVSREDGRKINKQFWASFKTFFKNKHSFFKKLEKQRYENLKYKEELVEKALLLQTSQDWDRTSDALKNLQKEWREIGPVPEKQKNDVYQRFKAACDAFFNSRRESNNEKEQEFHENLAIKEAICDELEKLAAEGSSDSAKMFELQAKFNKAGFVPRKSIKSISKRFEAAVAGFIKSASGLSESEKSDLKLRNEVSSMRASGENTDRKAQDIRRKIRTLEDDMALWKNNIEFFANSKNADALRKDIDQKIANAETKLVKMKEQLKLVRSI